MRVTSSRHVFCIIIAAATAPAFAGELDCGPGKCSIDALQPSQWKPTGCHEPVKPSSSKIASAADFDTAADKFNQWTVDVKAYMACVAKEATADAANAQQAIAKAGKDLQDAQVKAVQAEHDNLEAKRPNNTDAGKPKSSGY